MMYLSRMAGIDGRLLALATLIAVAYSCNKPPQSAPPPPSSVTVAYPVQHAVMDWDEYTGYLSSPDMANVEARVSGLIEQALFQEGSLVHKGQVLFVIDDRPFKADVDAKKADVARAQAQVDLATATLHRMDKVRNTKAISEEDYDTSKANLEQANAGLAAANAALETSQLNLQWTRVTAPITGRASRYNVHPGNLVNGGSMQSTTLLTTIVDVDPLYCYINVPQRNALRYQEIVAREKLANVANAHVPCFIQLENEMGFPHEGSIDFMDNRVDVNTGTIQMRGVIPNPDNVLAPGLFSRMRIPGSSEYQALFVPDVAVGTEQNERYLLIVDKGDVIRHQPVQLGPLFGQLRVITDGLKPGELVVVNGLQLVRQGMKVKPQETAIPASQIEALEHTLTPTTRPIPQSQPVVESHP